MTSLSNFGGVHGSIWWPCCFSLCTIGEISLHLQPARSSCRSMLCKSPRIYFLSNLYCFIFKALMKGSQSQPPNRIGIHLNIDQNIMAWHFYFSFTFPLSACPLFRFSVFTPLPYYWIITI